MIKMERRAKNREKLMAMKRFSGFLKRPEILGVMLRYAAKNPDNMILIS